MTFFVIIYKITSRIFLSIYSLYSSFYTWIKLKGNNVKFSSITSFGVPMIDIERGGSMIIGKNFRMNNGKYFNQIGRQQPCMFMVTKGGRLTIKDNVSLSATAFFCTQEITIGNNVKIGGNCVFYDTDFHSLNYMDRREPGLDKQNKKSLPVIIESDVFIGAHSTILKGVTIGEGSIIGAGSVVSKSVPPKEIWAGNPASFIKSLSAY
jgi:acetyltransferase-like isoleucine patch superfamily enzyme